MAQIDRFSVSLDTELLAAFDRHIVDRGYRNRSEAVRDMIRDLLADARLKRGSEPAAAILTLVCDYGEGDVTKRLRACLGDHAEAVSGFWHMPLDKHRDFAAIGFQGPSERIQAAANELQAMRGVTHGHLAVVPMTSGSEGPGESSR